MAKTKKEVPDMQSAPKICCICDELTGLTWFAITLVQAVGAQAVAGVKDPRRSQRSYRGRSTVPNVLLLSKTPGRDSTLTQSLPTLQTRITRTIISDTCLRSLTLLQAPPISYLLDSRQPGDLKRSHPQRLRPLRRHDREVHRAQIIA